MEQNLEHTIALLERTPATLDALLRDLPESWTLADEGEGTWSPREVVGHLVFNERTDWIPRTRQVIESGDSRAFEPFDRSGHKAEMQGKALPELLDEFARARAESLREVRALDLRQEDLVRRGLHPSFGGVTLSQLLAAWVAHDLTHLHQISRTLAHQYREAVGPWIRYLGVLHCDGHSEDAQAGPGPRPPHRSDRA